MNPNSEGTVIRDSRVVSRGVKLAIICVVIVLTLILVVAWYVLQGNQRYISTELASYGLNQQQEMVVTEIEEAEAQPFVFTLVPNALDVIVLEAPSASNTKDVDAYTLTKASVDLADPIDPEIIKNDIAYNLPFQGSTFGEYLNTLPEENRYRFFQMSDELQQLTKHFNEVYKRPPLKDRIEGVVAMAPQDTLVYPSMRAVQGFLAIKIMSVIDPQSSSLYEEVGEAFVQRGMLYGLYGQSDAEAAKSVVTQYLALYNPDSQ